MRLNLHSTHNLLDASNSVDDSMRPPCNVQAHGSTVALQPSCGTIGKLYNLHSVQPACNMQAYSSRALLRDLTLAAAASVSPAAATNHLAFGDFQLLLIDPA